MKDPLERQRHLAAKHPSNELARFSLGKALFDQEEFAEAREHLLQALTAKPDWMVAQILVGKCELALGHRDAARTAFERAQELAVAQHHEGPQEEIEQLLAEL